MSAIPPKTVIRQRDWHVGFVPLATFRWTWLREHS